MKKLRDWFYGRIEIPSSVWYVMAATMAAIYIISIMASLTINN